MNECRHANRPTIRCCREHGDWVCAWCYKERHPANPLIPEAGLPAETLDKLLRVGRRASVVRYW